MRLRNKVIVVTGGASGIGKAICVKAASEGAHVVVADIRERPVEGGDTTLNIIKSQGGQVTFCYCDVTNWLEVDNLIAEVAKENGTLDIMVNNAAAHGRSALLETTEEEWDRVLSVGAKGMFFGCKRAIQQMLNQEIKNGSEVRGRIVNISSQHGMIRAPNDFAYGVSKACAVYMTRQIAGDYARKGIVCNAVAPGKILTGRTGPTVSSETMQYSNYRTPWPRLGRPEDVASAVVFLASDDASFITGENLMVDGGWMAN
ncbi:MAG: short-chain dehydrogenase [Rhodospirillaceae bacterium]|nr:short-chain dehydrogenase [Rhodospirillaceae bacterium]|tara:strand:+ start:393 stop:1169 length:777 start_codon:yes stop_codon:yes gene_type:complete